MSYLKNRIRSELSFVRSDLWHLLHKTSSEFEVAVSRGEVKRIFKKNNLYFGKDGTSAWWYESFRYRRNTQDGLLKAVLGHINTNISKDSNFLITGCGTGWILFWLAQHGFKHLDGFDYISDVVNAANELSASLKIKTNIWQDDGFNPSSKFGEYDVVLALYWLYSAWTGNYGNKPCAPEDSYDLLKSFVSKYVSHLSKGGLLIVDLIDSIADFKVPVTNIYPIRHSGEQVARCADELGLFVEKKMFCGKHGHQPRMVYFIKKK